MTTLSLSRPEAPAASVLGSVHSWDISTGQDGPGLRFVLFTAGCPLACAFCHNPDTQMMRNGTPTTADDVLAQIARYRALLAGSGGVTVSGGEPLLQPAFTEAVLAGAKAMGLDTALDTSGVLGDRASDELLAATDLVLLDIKAIDPVLYRDLTGGSLMPTLRFYKRVWVRFVLVPGWTDAPEHVARLARHLAALGNVERVDVLGYHLLGREKYGELGLEDRLAGVPAATTEEVDAARAIFAAAGLNAP
jgi:pyruvate formate lyase activating enzyme